MTHSWQFPLIAAIFAAAVLTVNRGLPLPYALNICGGLIALTIGLSPNQFLDLAWEVLTQPAAIELLLSVFLIRWLGDIMDKSGNLARAWRLENLMGDRRLVSAVIPLITGLLMVPGGAILSAPAVQRLTDNMGLHPSRQAAINLIFRHIGQIVFPLSASFLVLTSTVGVSPVRQALYHLPIACAIGLFSFRFYFADVQRCPKSASSNPNKYAELKPLAVELSPVLVVVAVFALVHKIVLALGLGALWAVWRNRLSIQDAFATFRFKETMDSALLIVGTLVIQGIFRKDGSSSGLYPFFGHVVGVLDHVPSAGCYWVFHRLCGSWSVFVSTFAVARADCIPRQTPVLRDCLYGIVWRLSGIPCSSLPVTHGGVLWS